jgi:hypothetical protein
LLPGRPDYFDKKIAQNVAQPNFCQNQHITFTVWKSTYVGQEFGLHTCVFFKKPSKSKQSPNRWKIARIWSPCLLKQEFNVLKRIQNHTIVFVFLRFGSATF